MTATYPASRRFLPVQLPQPAQQMTQRHTHDLTLGANADQTSNLFEHRSLNFGESECGFPAPLPLPVLPHDLSETHRPPAPKFGEVLHETTHVVQLDPVVFHDLYGTVTAQAAVSDNPESASSFSSSRPRDRRSLEWLLDPDKRASDYTRLLAYLLRAEDEAHRAYQVEEAENYRLFFITVRNMEEGVSEPFAFACQTVFGLHPDKLLAAITARRKAKLGTLYSLWFDEEGHLRPDAGSKKSAKSEEREAASGRTAAA